MELIVCGGETDVYADANCKSGKSGGDKAEDDCDSERSSTVDDQKWCPFDVAGSYHKKHKTKIGRRQRC